MRRIRIAIAQFSIAEGDLAANWRSAKAALQQAGAGRADVVVLPEMWLTGYPYRRLQELAAATPESLGRVGVLAKKHGLFVVGSWAEKGEDGLPRRITFSEKS